MTGMLDLQSNIEILKGEIIGAIKVAIEELSDDGNVQPRSVSVVDPMVHSMGYRNTLDIKNLYLNEEGGLCGDFKCRSDGMDCGMAFGRSLEGLYIEDLYRVLMSLRRNTAKGAIKEEPAGDSKPQKAVGDYFRRSIWKNRLLRKGA